MYGSKLLKVHPVELVTCTHRSHKRSFTRIILYTMQTNFKGSNTHSHLIDNLFAFLFYFGISIVHIDISDQIFNELIMG